MNYTIFDLMYPKYKITKPIRLIELFAGYGSQALALKYLGVPFEHYKICEWAVKSIQAYRDIHFDDKKYNTQNNPSTKEYVVDYLYNLGISSNYNEPMTKQQIERLSFEELDKIYQNILVTNNLVNIQKVKGSDLEIVDTDNFDYILTYSFPCQDLSHAGKGKGMSDTSTRSGMLWEVGRILGECKELGALPQILLMENVPQVHSQENVKNFNKWQLILEKLGYKNYFEDLSATDYGIPQTRVRCFMISILGDYSYTFPEPVPLKLKLKDMLEDEVAEKYYVNDELLKHILNTKEEYKEYTQYGRYNGRLEQLCRVWKEKSPTLHTKCNEIEIYTKDNLSQLNSKKHPRRVQKNKVIEVNENAKHQQDLIQHEEGMCRTICCGTHASGPHLLKTQLNDFRIRKLTPKECFRLMGVKDEDFEKVSKNQSNSSLYHLAGDSIVINVLMAIFKELIE